jgi:heme/copper-type cytochrome/quinol oxidase subunit 2
VTAWALAAAVAAGCLLLALAPQAVQERRREHSVSARKYAFSPPSIEVDQGDVVRVTLTAEDIPHSFTVDAYRIAKRASPGRPVVFEFRADQPGSFPIYCNLQIDEKCRDMRATLVVRAR